MTLHVDASPAIVEVGPGQEFSLSVRVANTSPLIDGYSVRVFGLDAAWLLLEPRRLSLFPGDSGTVDITVTLPVDFPAGMRVVSIYVQSENSPTEFVISSVTVDVTSSPRITLALDPASQTAGNQAQFGMVVMNHGNSIVEGVPEAIDPEEQAQFVFTPGMVRLLPGERDVVQVGVRAPRPWVGPPKVRVLNFALATNSRVETMGTFMQRPRISRWVITVLGLIAVAALFAAVLSRTLTNVVAEAKVGDEIIEQALANDGTTGPLKVTHPASVKGTVKAGSSGEAVAGVLVALFAVDNPAEPMKTSASSDEGEFAFTEVAAGTYRIRFSGAGFADSWYGGGRNFAEAANIELSADEPCDLGLPPLACGATMNPSSGLGNPGSNALDIEAGGISLVGLPGTVSGTVTNDDPVGATATLVIDGITDPTVDAVVASVPVSANGTFELTDIPTPQVYTLVVERHGNATETRTIDLGPGASVEDLEIALRIGDGIVSGTITGAGQPLGGALVEATDGQNKVSTVSLTEGNVGTYSLRNLAVPGVYTITVTAPGFAPASQVVELTDGTPEFINANVFLSSAQSAITGTVRDSNGLLGGVLVTVTGPDVTVVGATESEGSAFGTFLVADLPIPATYTVTFSKTGYLDQVRQVTLDPVLGPTTAIDVLMNTDTVVVRGR
ncbi:MAG TPA: carboxypeptidase regulatory-like domain-containing protein, partial [Ilumatobacteraceae bacterium]|nr:carboxypeptidase regulatory-like domain-containing protein [Ilumatobacteraceae bacterium]